MPAQELSDAVRTANVELDSRFVQAMSNKDVEGAMGCLLDSPELVVVLWGTVLRGPQAIRQSITDLFAQMRSVHLEINEVTHWRLGDAVFAVGTATYEFEAPDGTKSTVKERWTDVRQNVAGKWVYVLDHAAQIP